MPDSSQLLYLEPDDEITSVVRRLREADAGRVVLVASGRSKATTSALALRLLAGVATEEGREVALVADPAGRALAAEAGIPAYASVADATDAAGEPAEPAPARRAPIHVVRGDAQAAAVAMVAPATPISHAGDETQVVPAVRPTPVAAGPRVVAPPRPGPRLLHGWFSGRPLPRVVIGAMVVVLLLGGALLAAVAPAASIVIEPASVEIEPVGYELTLTPAGADQDELTAETQGTATGIFTDPSPASGSVTFLNWNTVVVEVPQGTVVAAGEVTFATIETVNVPNGQFGLPIDPGEASVGVVAVEPGPAGNVAAEAIDTVVSNPTRTFLRGFPNNPNRLVVNPEATAGGSDNRQPEITQADVDTAVAALQTDLVEQLEQRLAEDDDRLYGPLDAGDVVIEGAEDLVGRRGEETFGLSGRLAYRRDYLELDDVEEAARERLLADAAAVPQDYRIDPDSVRVTVGDVTQAGASLRVPVMVRADADPVVDADAIRRQVAGLTGPQANAMLRSLGEVRVTLWPDWVDHVPQLSWRIDVRVEGDVPSSASPSSTGSASE